jgi:hypothetical protein
MIEDKDMIALGLKVRGQLGHAAEIEAPDWTRLSDSELIDRHIRPMLAALRSSMNCEHAANTYCPHGNPLDGTET